MSKLRELKNGVEYYIKDLILNNQGKFNSYHNTNHCIMVAQACVELSRSENLSVDELKTLKIAALYHDINHKGKETENDYENILLAINHVENIILPEDTHRLDEIKKLIKSTEYLKDRFKYNADKLSLSQKILRDADLTAIVSDDWFQVVCHGYAEESNIEINADWMQKQIKFNNSVEWLTDAGRKRAEKKLPNIIEDLNWLKGLL